METIGYEALSRFRSWGKSVPSYDFFKSIHNNTVLKKFQLSNRLSDTKLFINLDPDIAIDPNHIAFWVNFFDSHEKVVIEIIKKSDEDSAEDIEHFMDWLDEYSLPYAYDDYAKPNSMFFTSLLHRADTLKLDIDFLRTIRKNNPYIEMAKGLVNYAHLSNKQSILEGVESESDLELAREIGVDFITKWKN